MKEVFSNLYSSLIKANITLECRNQIAAHTAKKIRELQREKWETIVSRSKQLQLPLNHLRSKGWIEIQLPEANKLALELRSLPTKGKGEIDSGNRSETEYLKDVTSLPEVKKILQNRSLYDLASNYLGSPAFLYDCMAWWQYPMGKEHLPSNAQLWHRDRDDLGVLKLFFYASDVDETSGPHIFLPKSHTSEGLRESFSKHAIDDEVINGQVNRFVDDKYLQERGLIIPWKQWTGKSGTCMIEDTRAFHRASIPTQKPRLIFSLVWTIGRGFNPNTSFRRPEIYQEQLKPQEIVIDQGMSPNKKSYNSEFH